MPNYCSNCLTVEGEAHVVAQFVAAMIRVNEQNHHDLDFNGVLPYPEPWASMDREMPSWLEPPSPEKEARRLAYIAKWGTDRNGFNSGGYEWCSDTWGTKWNALDCNVSLEDTNVTVYFETAWSPPQGVLQAMAQRWPDLRIVCASQEGGVGFRYVFLAQNGKMYDKSWDWFEDEEDEEDAFDGQTYLTDLDPLLLPAASTISF